MRCMPISIGAAFTHDVGISVCELSVKCGMLTDISLSLRLSEGQASLKATRASAALDWSGMAGRGRDRRVSACVDRHACTCARSSRSATNTC
eukprot:172448-Prymnesium_polylepis.3